MMPSKSLHRIISVLVLNIDMCRIAQVTEKTLVVGVDIGSDMNYVDAFCWRVRICYFHDQYIGIPYPRITFDPIE